MFILRGLSYILPAVIKKPAKNDVYSDECKQGPADTHTYKLAQPNTAVQTAAQCGQEGCHDNKETTQWRHANNLP